MPGKLYIVATPIGNLEDITKRALRVLSEVDLIAAEDTRHTRKLLTHYNIHNNLVAYHEHNEERQAQALFKRLKGGTSIALVTNAGTPGISDPGYRLICRSREDGVTIIPVPGPSAAIAALSISGLPTDQFYFAGFPPMKIGKRKSFFEGLRNLKATLIFYESPHRIHKTLALMRDIFGNRNCAVVREMTKIHEEFIRGPIGDIVESLSKRSLKGEMVILLEGVRKSPFVSKR